MGATSRERYAVVSCHVERPLDDAVWTAYTDVLGSVPGGFRIASLLRPPDVAFGEDEAAWLRRAREAARAGPFGHHTHWTAPDHARPRADLVTIGHKDETGGAAFENGPLVTDRHKDETGRGTLEAGGFVTDRHKEPGARVLAEGGWIREHGLEPTLFCGGGWYADRSVAEACAELGYVDCTVRTSRPGYLPEDSPWAELAAPARVDLPSGRMLRAIPTTHSLGELARALAGWRLPDLVHVYFHDTDLLDRRRRLLLTGGLRILARRAAVVDLDELATQLLPDAPRIGWNDVARL